MFLKLSSFKVIEECILGIKKGTFLIILIVHVELFISLKVTFNKNLSLLTSPNSRF